MYEKYPSPLLEIGFSTNWRFKKKVSFLSKVYAEHYILILIKNTLWINNLEQFDCRYCFTFQYNLLWRRGLTSLPVLAADAQVKLLSLQHNLITRLDNISIIGLSKLVFLDLYDNQLDRIAGLDALSTLRVLLVGKNRWVHVQCLHSLVLTNLTYWFILNKINILPP